MSRDNRHIIILSGTKTDESTKTDVDVLDVVSTESRIIVFNDEVNTFDWVIQCFIEICGHSAAQAEQLSLLIHFKGKATVKTGPRPELQPMATALLDRGLSVELTEV